MPENLLLIGMMGAGKTTVGRGVAAWLRRPFHDSDEEVLARAGLSVPEIFASRGEPAFRAEEKAVLATALSLHRPAVVAVAGGAVFDPDSRRRMRAAGAIIWLRARPDTLARRVGSGAGRPLLEHDPAGTIARLYAARRPVYAALADGVVEVDSLPPVAVVERVARLGRHLLEGCR